MPVEHDVAYGTGDGRDLRCDMYRPETSNGAGLLLLHAGSWRRGDKTSMAGQAAILTAAGYTCVASAYRVVTEESPWPAQLHGVKAVLRWMRATVELHLQAKRGHAYAIRAPEIIRPAMAEVVTFLNRFLAA